MSPIHRFQMPMPSRDGGEHVTQPHYPASEPFPKLVEPRSLPCAACGVTCRYESSTSRDPGSPEFLRAQPDVWLAFLIDPRTDTLDLVAACSEACVQRLLRE